nr:MAG TPA: hypothetical protein [Caudoviricetes sp.]
MFRRNSAIARVLLHRLFERMLLVKRTAPAPSRWLGAGAVRG